LDGLIWVEEETPKLFGSDLGASKESMWFPKLGVLILICDPKRILLLCDDRIIFPDSFASPSSRESIMLNPTLLQSQLFGLPSWDNLGDLEGLVKVEQTIKSNGEVGLLTESDSEALGLNPTNRPGTVKKELVLCFCLKTSY